MENLKCDKCSGLGYTAKHSEQPHPNGECPIQVECSYCEGKGILTPDLLMKKEYNRQMNEAWQKVKDSDNNDLPF